MNTVNRARLAKDWKQRRADGYDAVVIGSGYGGAITAARLAAAHWPGTPPSICVLERGREWLPGEFADRLDVGAKEVRSPVHPLGLYDLRFSADIGAVAGSGLGGTSLINANVAIQPDPEVFDDPRWPEPLRQDRDRCNLQKYYERVRAMLCATPHPRGMEISKVRALKRCHEGFPDSEFKLHDLAVNFRIEGTNPWGVEQRRCINCGDCISGCNLGAKNSLDTNYLAVARAGGADLFTQIEVRYLEKGAQGGYLVHYVRHVDTRRGEGGEKETGTLRARRLVVVAAGALGSTAILLRSRERGLSLPDTVGTRVSGNGDFFGIAYNGATRTDVLGWGAHPESERCRRMQNGNGSGHPLNPGPTVVSYIKFHRGKPLMERFKVEDSSIPLSYVDAIRNTLAASPLQYEAASAEAKRCQGDLGANDPELQHGALNHTLIYLVNGHDDASGQILLDADTCEPAIRWPQVGDQETFQKQNAVLFSLAQRLHSTYVENPLWATSPFRTLVTMHPLGGCPMGEDHSSGAVNHLGQVFDGGGQLHEGLYVGDAAVIPTSIGVNPLLTISALAERRAEHLVVLLGGTAREPGERAAASGMG